MADQPENYNVEPPPGGQSQAGADDGATAAQPRMAGAGIPRPADVQPLRIEEEDEAPDQSAASSVKALDVCPNCGATMRGTDQLVCIRCGFDLKTMRSVQTNVGVVTAEEEAAATETQKPLIQPGNGEFWLPAIMAGASGVILLVGYLAGLPGLFFEEPGEPIGFGPRVTGVLREIVLVGMFTACGMGALMFVAAILGRKTAATIEDLKLGSVRMLGIVLTMRVATLIALASPTLEWMLETPLQVAVFGGLSIALFRLTPRDAATLTGAALGMFVVIWMAAWAVIWATGV